MPGNAVLLLLPLLWLDCLAVGLTALLSQVSSPAMPSLVSNELQKELASSCLTFVLSLPLQVATPQALATADGAAVCC
jgi:hypothetical protein